MKNKKQMFVFRHLLLKLLFSAFQLADHIFQHNRNNELMKRTYRQKYNTPSQLWNFTVVEIVKEFSACPP